MRKRAAPSGEDPAQLEATPRPGGDALPEQQHDFNFVGLIGLEDLVRPTVAPAIRECHNAGIRVVMITGDYPVTAQNIAHQIDLTPDKDG